MSEPFIGEIRAWALDYAPRGWAMCNGQSIPITQQQALYAVIGPTYGGDMRTVFSLPDLRGAAPMAAGTPNSKWALPDVPVAQKLGAAAITLTSNNLPNHTHQAVGAVGAVAAMTAAPSATSYIGRPTATAATYSSWTGPTASAPTPTSNTVMAANMIALAGGGLPHENRQPFLTLNFCIAQEGVFPLQQ